MTTDWDKLTTPAPSAWPQAHVGNVSMCPQEQAAELPPELTLRLRAASLPENRDGALLLWQRSKEALEIAKEDEMSLRKLCAALLVSTPVEGVNTVPLGNGFAAKVGIKYNYTLKAPEGFKGDTVDAVDEAFEALAKIGNEGAFVAERLFKYKVDISLTEYRKLCEEAPESIAKAEMLKIVNGVLEIKEAAPTLKIKEPKVRK